MKFKSTAIFLSVVFLFLLPSCKKDQNSRNATTPSQEIIEAAKSYFRTSIEASKQNLSGIYRVDALKTVDWENAQVAILSQGPCVIAPVHYTQPLLIKSTFGEENLFSLNDIAHLIIYKGNANRYRAEIVTSFPDPVYVNSSLKSYAGFVLVEKWSGERLHQLKYNPDGSVLEFRPGSATQSLPSKIIASKEPVHPDVMLSICYEINGYNYAANDPDGGYSWTESLGCTNMYFPGDFGGAGAGSVGYGENEGGGASASDYGSVAGSSRPVPKIALITNGPNTIADIRDYIKCFTNVGGSDHTYTVTVCVDQPIPGTREPWRLQNSPGTSSATNNPVDVGHTFLVFTESYGGKAITRNIGFYPRAAVYPWSPSAQGQLNDNEITSYNISLTITITNAQFFNMLNYASQGNNPGYLYDINTNNCTTFVLNTLKAGSVNISSKIGDWASGSGYDPGDLGEDIRTMPLTPNMSRNTVENFHPNVGICN